MIVGIVLSIFQAATSIQEMTLTFVPKIIITGVAIILMLPFMIEKIVAITHRMFNLIEQVAK